MSRDYDEKEYYLSNPPDPDEHEIDDPLCALELMELQDHIRTIGVAMFDKEAVRAITKFLDKNFI